jgi:uncharacterized protein (TIGR02271 family)
MSGNRYSGAEADPAAADKLVVPLLEEEVRVAKEEVSTGRVRVRTLVETVEEQARAVLEGERVEITRVPVDRVVDEAPSLRTEDGVTIVPVLEEGLFVEKRLVLKEELHIRRHATTETVEVPVTLRKQRAVVDRMEGGNHVNSNEELEP